MWVRASRLRAEPSAIDALIADFTGNTVDKLKEIPGNAGAVLLVERREGTALALTYWKDRAALDASESAAAGLRSSVAGKSGATVERVQRGEVLLMERTGPPQVGFFVRVVNFSLAADRIDSGVAYTRDSVVPLIRTIDGFRALICGVDREGGTGYISTVWESLDALRASDVKLTDVRREAVRQFGGSEPAIDVLESVYVDIAAPVTP
jgi:heme-degrading monooxygenase HmoA